MKTDEQLREQADALHAEAGKLLHEEGLLPLIQSYGSVCVIGSYTMDLMTWPDIDVSVRLPNELDIATFFTMGQRIATTFQAVKMTFSNQFIRPDVSFDRGLYWGIRLQFGGRIWKIDLWGYGEEDYRVNRAMFEELQASMAGADRLAILRIKDVICRQENYRAEISSVQIYEAVSKDGVQALAELPLFAQPGTTWRYSVATDVLGYLVECLSGQSLDVFFAERIFGPLGMEDTGFHLQAQKLDRLASCYSLSDEGLLQDIDPVSESVFARPALIFSGGGGLVSTPTDYQRFCQMMLNGGVLEGNRLLGRKTVELMTLNHLPPALVPIGDDGALYGYGQGLGFAVLVDVAAAKRPGSTGSYSWGGAATTSFWIDPKEQLIGIFMTQFVPSNVYPVSEDFRILVYQAIDD